MRLINISMMHIRYLSLVQALAGYKKTGVLLVAWDGVKLSPVWTGDDAGLFYFVPKVAALTHGSVQQAINLFSIGVMCAALLLGVYGGCLLFKTPLQRAVVVLGLLLLARVGLGIGDVYLYSVAGAVGIVPLFLWFQRQNKITPVFGGFLFAAGAFVAVSNWIRSQSGTSVVLFMAILLLAGRATALRSRLALVLCLFAGLILPQFAFKSVENRTNTYLVANQPGYRPLPAQHVIWHSVYIGFGYLNNDYGLAYKDQIAAAKVASVDPTVPYCSAAYERILRQEVFRFIRAHPGFVLETASAKIGVLLVLLIRYANIGLIFAWRFRRRRAIDAAFLTAIAAGTLPGLLVMPFSSYAISAIAFTVLYSVYCINSALETEKFTRFRKNTAALEGVN